MNAMIQQHVPADSPQDTALAAKHCETGQRGGFSLASSRVRRYAVPGALLRDRGTLGQEKEAQGLS